LAQRGYNVTLFEKNSALALEASGNPQAILYANFFGNCPNNLELSYLGYNYSQTLIKQLLTTAHEFAACGIIQLAYKDSITKQQQQLSSQVAFKHILSPVTATEINTLCNTKLVNNNSGIYFPSGMWLSPTALINKLVAQAHIQIKYNTHIKSLQQRENLSWQLIDANNNHYQFSNVVVCNAYYATQFAQLSPLTPYLRKIRGQLSIIHQANNLACVLCNNGYITPSVDNRFIIGASFKFDHHDCSISETEHEENLANFTPIIPDIMQGINRNKIEGRVGIRTTSNDYLPLVGSIAKYTQFCQIYKNLAKDANYWLEEECPYWRGLFVNLAHGAKGFLTAPLSAEIIAEYIENKNGLVSERLSRALHPNRFYRRELIKHS